MLGIASSNIGSHALRPFYRFETVDWAKMRPLRQQIWRKDACFSLIVIDHAEIEQATNIRHLDWHEINILGG